MAKEDEYKEMFLSEAQESYEELNTLFTKLEKDIQNTSAINAIFRITHTLKGNAMGLGYESIAELSHVMEDVFNAIKINKLKLDDQLFASLFRANDVLGKLIQAQKTGEKVRYKGIRTKLKVVLNSIENKAVETIINGEEILTESQKETSEEIDNEDNFADSIKNQIMLADMVQVPVRKLDNLLNIVGELLIEKDTLAVKSLELGLNSSDMARLHRITSDLQYSVMDIRLVQVGFLFKKFHRIVRDVAQIENKKVDLILKGTKSEIDRNVLKIMSDSLVHLVRNSVSHGIESAEERLKKGKPAVGKVTLNAWNEKDSVFIEISDDGNGIDINQIKAKAIAKGLIAKEHSDLISEQEVIMCIFEPGFSNAEQITEVSGRGVGLDVVRMSVEAIGGKIAVETELGKGSKFILSMPSSLAVKEALLFELDKQEFAITLNYTEAVLSLKKSQIHKISNGLIAKYLGKTISIIFLRDLFDMEGLANIGQNNALHQSFDKLTGDEKLDVVIISYNGKSVGLVVDKLVQQKEIVEKNLAKPIDYIELFSGATILGNGNVCLVLNVIGILNSLFRGKSYSIQT